MSERPGRGVWGLAPMTSRCPSGHQRSGCWPTWSVSRGRNLRHARLVAARPESRLLGLQALGPQPGRVAGAFGWEGTRSGRAQPGDLAARPRSGRGPKAPGLDSSTGHITENTTEGALVNGTGSIPKWHHGLQSTFSGPAARGGHDLCPVCGSVVERAADGRASGLSRSAPGHAAVRRAVISDSRFESGGIGDNSGRGIGDNPRGGISDNPRPGGQTAEESGGPLPLRGEGRSRLPAQVEAVPRKGGQSGELRAQPEGDQVGDCQVCHRLAAP